jgi:hypothetical protein
MLLLLAIGHSYWLIFLLSIALLYYGWGALSNFKGYFFTNFPIFPFFSCKEKNIGGDKRDTKTIVSAAADL